MNEKSEYKVLEGTKDSYQKQLYWNMAIGLQQVDNLTPSLYLKELVTKNIDGIISNFEVEDSLHNYYKTQEKSNKKIIKEQECDIVSTRIVELLSDFSFSFRPITLKSIHEYLFKGIYDFAGKYRNYNITKEEPIIDRDTVIYADYNEIERTFEYDFKKEMEFDYSKFSIKEQIEHLAIFTSNIWQVHPFGEGNTRSCALLIVKYLRSLGYNINYDLFKEHSLYFRNALVKSNYSNRVKNIYSTNKFLIMFFENLLDNGTNILSNEDF